MHSNKYTNKQVKPVISIKNLTVTFPKGFFLQKKNIINNLSFTVSPGECMGVIGNNGSGKTTLLKALSGLIVTKSGSIQLPQKKMGYVPERYYGPPFLTAKQFMVYMGKLYGIKKNILYQKIEQLFSQYNLHQYADEQIKYLSQGSAQRLYIAQALIHEPQVLLLDEPFSGLDHASVAQLKRSLKKITQKGTALLCATHTIESEYFDRVLHL